KIDFARSPFFVNDRLRPWTASPRRAGVSSFGIGGTNAHVILEQAPPSPPPAPGRAHQLFLLSARTRSALDAATANLARHLAEPRASAPAAGAADAAALQAADVAYTLHQGRRHFPHRRMVVARTLAEAAA